jgi:hydrogenase nickel incorporation protein HypB
MNVVVNNIQQIHPNMPVFEVSAKTQDGFSAWIDWIKKQVKIKAG